MLALPRNLPDGVEPYALSPVFTRDTIPNKLTRVHETKGGVYGRIQVSRGIVRYHLEDDNEPLAEIHEGENWVILPTERHFVVLSKDAEFHIEFCR